MAGRKHALEIGAIALPDAYRIVAMLRKQTLRQRFESGDEIRPGDYVIWARRPDHVAGVILKVRSPPCTVDTNVDVIWSNFPCRIYTYSATSVVGLRGIIDRILYVGPIPRTHHKEDPMDDYIGTYIKGGNVIWFCESKDRAGYWLKPVFGDSYSYRNGAVPEPINVSESVMGKTFVRINVEARASI